MMFNKDLFLSLCEKYGVELSDCDSPMIKKENDLYPLTDADVISLLVEE